MPEDRLTTPRTPEELAELFEKLLRALDRLVKPDEITCSHCDAAPTCPGAFDEYNLDGDCIMEK